MPGDLADLYREGYSAARSDFPSPMIVSAGSLMRITVNPARFGYCGSEVVPSYTERKLREIYARREAKNA